MGLAILLGAAWGLAEATLFFLVPDVALTYLTVVGPRAAWAGCAAAVVGALAGGWLMYRWGARDAERANAAVIRLPAIDRREVAAVRARVGRSRFGAVFLGPLLGTPYKLYAIEAGRRGLPLGTFLLLSVPARGMRFVGATALWLWLAGGPLASLSQGTMAAVTTVFWIVFYAAYFRLKGR